MRSPAKEIFPRIDCILRDLKPENMLICANGYTKITDLGFAKRLGSDARYFNKNRR